ncbi:MAG: HD domain-containing phosphohydrolase [Methylotenera sp.]|uniref:HD family phosphohydrolase n=1 Tax=Methylotenera sp. TaxID=2051956 RepID=UPI002716BF62|nr:HD family phosphohydrolase [Methylotenera sp.]MDO9393935.1 HD domain-containing phosphohydrolase [Methylotenera sp.]MDP1521539.1 HD domain-containing phosphohydrolase [Methylotenera sp.]MDP2230032.1 HD domain-containing phosphohydrolase [Methylotenera sp.]MDP3140087.1 HD domain-containing phosphohydrolase [Methylotenera sp.]
MIDQQHPYLLKRLERLNAIGVALSAERDNKRLLEMILLGAQEITNADGGTLYTITDDKHLKFEMMSNKTLNIALGGTTGKEIPFLPIPMYLEDGSPNLTTVVAYATLNDKTVNIENVYQTQDFDFTGTRKYDEKTGYHSQSFLTIPMKNHEEEVIGVLQLINAIDIDTQEIIPFSQANQSLVESLASQAAVAMTSQNLIEGLKALFEAFIELIAEAIDQKSPYTGGHCRRVPELTMMLAQAAIDTKVGPLKDFMLNEKEFYELKIAGWLHDCGKVTTPESVMDKPTKLSGIFDRIDLVDQRFELLKSQAECEFLKKQVEALRNGQKIDFSKSEAALAAFKIKCDADRDFLRKTNFGSEYMTSEDQQRVIDIAAALLYDSNGIASPILSANEVYNLNIVRGTLTAEEREVINNHIVVTINMLDSLPYPNGLKRVPEYACGHHERMDGRGYPKGLTREQMSVPARVMGIADIFEALTSKDRPYKKAKTLSESLYILGKMKEDQHIDPDLFDIFVRDKVYLKYAQQFLESEQIDDVDETKIPGYQP